MVPHSTLHVVTTYARKNSGIYVLPDGAIGCESRHVVEHISGYTFCVSRVRKCPCSRAQWDLRDKKCMHGADRFMHVSANKF